MYADGYIDVSEEKKLFYDMAHSIRALQDESGLWRQVLNRREEGSYPETSCTGMFLLAFTRGVKYGWLEKDFLDCMEKAWNGLLVHSIDGEGNVYGEMCIRDRYGIVRSSPTPPTFCITILCFCCGTYTSSVLQFPAQGRMIQKSNSCLLYTSDHRLRLSGL